MSGKRQGKGCKESWYGKCRKRNILSLLLCAALALGVSVPEYGMSVRAAEPIGNYEQDVSYMQEENGSQGEIVDSVSYNAVDASEEDSVSRGTANILEEDSISWDAADVSEGDSVSGNAAMPFSGTEEDNTGDNADEETAKPFAFRVCQCGYIMNVYTYGMSADEKAAWSAHSKHHLAYGEPTNYHDNAYRDEFPDDELLDITWTIDTDGKLTVEGTGELSVVKYGGRTPWYNQRKSIKAAVVRVTGLQDASYMFDGCSELASVDLSGFDTSSVTDMGWMFHGCSSLVSVDMSSFDTSSVTNMAEMFYGCSSLTSLDMSGVNTGGVTSMGHMFEGCSSLESLDVNGFNTSRVTNMEGMFAGCSGLTSLDVGGFDTGSVTRMGSMFSCCSSLTGLDLGGFDTSRVTNMMSMFYGCSSLTGLDLSSFDTSGFSGQSLGGSVDRSMASMFYGCSNLASLDVSGFDTSNVKAMHSMFYGCRSLTSLDVSGFDTGSVLTMSGMFEGCSSLTGLDLSGFDAGSTTDMARMLNGCSSLSMLCTPYHIPESHSVSLPVAENDVWYDSAGATYTALPTETDHSIVLARNTTPDAMSGRLIVRLSKSFYEPGSVVKPEDLTVKYRGPDGTTTVLVYKGEGVVSGYIMGAVDTSTPGLKTLTISYDNGTDTLTQSVTFTVSASLTDDMVALPEGEYVYNGKAQKPIPVVKSAADGTRLIFGRDYTVSYTDNIEAGEATVSVTGRNAYSGTASKTFTIRRAQPVNMEVTFPEPFQETRENSTRNLAACFDGIAPNNGGITGYTLGEITEHNLVADGGGSVLSGVPSINMEGILTYSTNAGTVDDTVLIPVTVTFAKNYEDALILVTVCLKDMVPVSISGITVENVVYSGDPVSHEGTAVVRADDGMEGEAGTDITSLVTLSYHYIGAQADGTAYNSGIAPVHAGSYILNVAVTGSDSYTGSAEYPFTIGKAPLTVVAQDVELEAGAFDALPDENTFACDVAGLCGTHTGQDVLSSQPVVSYGLNGEKIDKTSIAIDRAGSYELIPSGGELNRTAGSDYEIQSYQNGTLTITGGGTGNPDDPDEPDPSFPDDGTFRVSTVPAQTYTGKAIKPAVRVYYGSRRLTEKTDYTIAYKNNIKANDATVEKTAPTITVTGKGNYSGKQIITFVIKPKNIAEEDVTAAELIAAQSSKVQKPVPKLTYQGKKLKNKTDFVVGYPDGDQAGAYQSAGTYTITVTGTGNYTGTRDLTYTITDKTLITKAKITVKPKDYTGSAVTLDVEDITVKVGKKTLAYGTDYTLNYRNNIQAGKAAVIVTGAGDNYAGTKEATFQIKGESIAKAQITGIASRVYSGDTQTQKVQVKLDGKTLQEGADYVITYAKAVNAGTASMTITGKGGYTGSVKKTFKITAYDLQTDEADMLQGVPKNLTVAYTKGGSAPALTLTFNGKPLTVKKDYTVIYKNNKKPASASDTEAPAMVVKGRGNFKGTLTIPFSITTSNLAAGGNVEIAAEDIPFVNRAGKYVAKLVLTDANGKKLTAGIDYEKPFAYTLVDDADGTETALDTLDIVPTGSKVKVTVTGKGNYTGTLSATYRITKASFSKAKATIKPQTYTGSAITLNPKDITVKLGNEPLIYGKDYTIVEGSYQNNTKKGTATVKIKGRNDYGGIKTVKFKITAKPLAGFVNILETLKDRK